MSEVKKSVAKTPKNVDGVAVEKKAEKKAAKPKDAVIAGGESSDAPVQKAPKAKAKAKVAAADSADAPKKASKAKKAAAPEQAEGSDDASGEQTAEGKKKKPRRSFTVQTLTKENQPIELTDKDVRRYFSKTPAGAARKAAGYVCKKKYPEENDCTIGISMKESTKGSSQKEYPYIATRKLSEKDVPFKGGNGNVTIPFKWSMTLKSLRKDAAGRVVEETVSLPDESTVDATV